jgi:hypothetical protein
MLLGLAAACSSPSFVVGDDPEFAGQHEDARAVDAPDVVDGSTAVDPSETDARETDARETDARETDARETDAGETDAGETDARIDDAVDPATCGADSDCEAGAFCDRPGCSARGACRVRPTVATFTFAPVCGCDDVTYWSSEHAASVGRSVRSKGDCRAIGRSLRCGTVVACPSGAICVRERDTASACMTTIDGACWSIPARAACDASAMEFAPCGESACMRRCDAVRSGKPFSPSPSCAR